MTTLTPKRVDESATEMIQAVLPNDANPLGFMLGGAVMHLIDIAGAITCLKHTRQRVVTAAVDGLQFLHPIRIGDLVILKAQVTCTFTTSLEVQVQVFSEEALTGVRKLTCHAYLTFVAVDEHGNAVPVHPLLLETDEAHRSAAEARARREQRLRAKQALLARETEMLRAADGRA
ncbi:MAG: acyl-CoA thioesterase [Luteitalea sp.]|nr:acyl-CoA thioesterase [Luteitalea sp.]